MVKKAAKNFYQMLGVEPEASAVELKKAYRELVKNHHPDVQHNAKTARQRVRDTEFMMQLNQAYETLRDRRSRAAYDLTLSGNGGIARRKSPPAPTEDPEAREIYLGRIFHPARQAMVKVIGKYKQELADLSLDIYDDDLVMEFEKYVDELEAVLRKASNDLSSRPVPRTLTGAVQMMRYAIAQGADALDELRRFCQNYDYNHLHMAQNLFRECSDLARKALHLSKG